MTTLPQTTAIRVPRPSNGSNMLAIPGGVPTAMGPAHPPGLQMTGADVWRVIRGNLWLIIGIVILSGVVGFGLFMYLKKYYPSYTAKGYIQIQAETVVFNPLEPQVNELNQQMLVIHQRTQAQLLSNEALFSQVLQNPDKGIRQTEWFKQFIGSDGRPDVAAAKEELGEEISVRPIPDSVLVEVSMSYRNPKDARTIVMDLVDEHLEDQRKGTNDAQSTRSATLQRLRTKYEYRLNELGRQTRELVVKLNIGGASGQPGRYSAKEIQLTELLKLKFELEKERNQLVGELATLRQQVQNGVDPAAAMELIDRDPDVNYFRQQLNGIEMELAANRFGPDHKETKRLEQMRQSAQQSLDAKRAEVALNVKTGLLETLEAQQSQMDNELKSLAERINATQSELGDLAYMATNYLTMTDEAKTLRELVNEIDKELASIQQAQQQADLSGITWARRPETPDLPSSPKLGLTLGGALMVGLCLSLGIAFLRELLDTSVRSPRDIARVGQLNMLGMIPHEGDDPQAAGAPLPLVIAHAPHSMLAEQFRQVRTRLQHAAQLESTRSILVTSPSPGDGKSTVATNLAVGLALNGRRILLVDANFRRPELHKIFGMPNDQGFAAVLSSADSFASAVQPTQIPNLDVLPSGVKPANSTELLESALLTDFIEQALEEYDHVIFDTGPLLFASETVAMASRVDGVVSVVRARANSRGLLQRMRDELRKLKAEHLGVVLNAVRSQAGGYYNRNIKTYYAYQNGHA